MIKKKKSAKDASDTISVSEDGQDVYVDTETSHDAGGADDLYMDTEQTEGDVYNDVAENSAEGTAYFLA